ncbi:uncharacterized protein LOC142319859 [Lycorma delicatula]|uniref:uncharacterized protein LOC142319859 n=1 Tax=Lycorma delicatula TaxID=130591 RepID=UPI003F510C76
MVGAVNTNELDIYNKYKQAVIIQKWFRGYITRKHIKYLHAQATIIQKNWRGFCGRHTYYLLLKKTVKEFHEKNYNHLATIIQKTWRGYLYRKYVFSYIKLKQWKNLILKKNKFCLQLTKFCTSCFKQYIKQEEMCIWLFYILFKAHHLLRTYQMKGIYSTKGNSNSMTLQYTCNQAGANHLVTVYGKTLISGQMT